jgi:myo-inositol 2-dehydrogenase/D-chiro-inositol 1-dehydrogenase
MSKPMTFALVGYGAWGRFHARSIAAADQALLSTIVANSGASADAAAQDWPKVAVLRDWRAALADPAIEAVAVATPNHLHAEIAVAALEAGKHVLLEKPMATSLADCDRLVAAARRSGKVLTVGHELRLSPQWGRIRSLIDEGAIGRPEHVHIALFRFPYRQGSGGWRYDLQRIGSWILEEPIHFFDAMLWYLAEHGRPVAVSAIGTGGDAAMSRTLSVHVRFSNGATGAINQILAGFEHHQTVEVVGDKGAVRALWSGVMDRTFEPVASLRLKRAGASADENIPIERSGEVFELEAQAVAAVEAFRSGKPIVSAEEGRAAVALCLAAERSAREGREVPIDSL